MIDFMLIAAPRSGTAWASVWLTDRNSFCYHDPLWDTHFEDLDRLAVSHERELCGIACTGVANFLDWVVRHPAKKLILHRPRAEVGASAMRTYGWPPPTEQFFRNLERIPGLHRPWTDLWENPREIWEYLMPDPFDAHRHAVLRRLNIQTQPRTMSPELRARYAREGVILRD